ncbi:MAG: bifunctional NADP-dependent methylenetetrahydromethanopterin dehydrogenase/methylenetetrahydrofolate dehydrogenase [Planctomycetaceae bacterium]|jgi:methylenetetrahydrofolate/methylenetetrahydromethanopterin dehydrogenase (NADP+)|nr:bifunctional NADP-dependent methylenetetrahydromethanopterin dehydrogenase/methylenetetrahydrofolate dehydrogenase [Planctomycetaceae bacterium]MBT6157455.1 bifunctional NADP-dependent methylenetetrahydromethanopterin dehydrogenase/methylenetetrahydrofolate dehydrogenase [Planctomycetaceae bacterium]MBT6488108.1 bifunctional NADP-dependent methylenetetrahydromethanopterin dehydrogenase/methylenetetrahydrofolate dehydrogenase [Planctomycetaceae bacterium]MBT6498232.1 bifunctional NADP-dependen
MRRILIQLDTDAHPSAFDRVVAVDAGVDELFSYAGVTPNDVESLVHGAIFTRGPADLKNTAIFIGGSDVAAGEALLERVNATFFGPMRVSVMIDSNGSNTTAAAAVLRASRHVEFSGLDALVLAGTGPVGQRAAQLLAKRGANVRLASRSLERAESACAAIKAKVGSDAKLTARETSSSATVEAASDGVALIIAGGAAGVQLLADDQWPSGEALKVAIDLNAVPPVGLAGVEPMDKAVERHGTLCYGAIGVGGTKMKIHKAAIGRLFDSNDQILDTEAIYRIGEELD